ncbi:hypothetical protein BJ138DRAFT_1011291 [Hygrophoropsis aurantiaca]|uniref:Uncharacterized protein n=1 Tax=Hygrophoropsis aurantiaca TaxID=72124 RepID=A0ACB8A892_9AGAM|nr:hypothetical protein BJ138DRAFT_1011291 [Hygrophoropsis aurantiaca]
MALPINMSSAPSAGNSSSDESTAPPHTPASPADSQTLELTGNTQPQSPGANSPNSAITQPKRKPSRRANTAERRATHNAVERQRRETLNGRFLDLAALLPNLSQIRRPSKSAIVNSSIAHIHASRRHRLLASRELRILKLESDALRRELNEWRDRAGLPRVDEPVRGEGFNMVLSGEVEILAAVVDDEEGQYEGYEEGDDEFAGSMPSAADDVEDVLTANAAAMLKNANAFGHNDVNIAHLMPRGPPSHHSGPMVAQMSPTVSYENPAMASLYEPHIAPHFPGAPYIPHHAMGQTDTDKVAAWNANMYSGFSAQQLQQLQAQRGMITPPTSSHGAPGSTPSPVSGNGNNMTYNDQALLANLKRQQILAMQYQHQALAYPIDVDDASSVGSSQSGRERRGSFSTGSGYGSPHGSSPVNYELSGASDHSASKRMSANLHINTGANGLWTGREDAMGNMMMKRGSETSINVGGGNNGGYGMML